MGWALATGLSCGRRSDYQNCGKIMILLLIVLLKLLPSFFLWDPCLPYCGREKDDKRTVMDQQRPACAVNEVAIKPEWQVGLLLTLSNQSGTRRKGVARWEMP